MDDRPRVQRKPLNGVPVEELCCLRCFRVLWLAYVLISSYPVLGAAMRCHSAACACIVVIVVGHILFPAWHIIQLSMGPSIDTESYVSVTL